MPTFAETRNKDIRHYVNKLMPIGIFVFFIINPCLCLPLLFVEIYNGKKYPLYLLAFFMGLLAMYYFPQGDQYRYRAEIISYQYRTFDEVFNFNHMLIIRNLNLISIFMFLMSRFSWIDIGHIRLILIFIGTMMIFSIYSREIRKNDELSRRKKFILFTVIFLSIPYYYISQGFRTGFGACVLTYGLYLMVKGKSGKGIFFVVLSMLVHYSYVLFGSVYLFSIFIKKKITWKSLIIYMGCILAFVVVTFVVLYNAVPYFKDYLNIYIYGSYGTEFEWNAYRIKEILLINTLPVTAMYIIYLMNSTRLRNIRTNNLLYVNLALLILSLPFQAFLQRIGVTSLLLIGVFSCINYKSIPIIKYWQIIVLLQISSFGYPFFMHRYAYYNSGIEYFPFSSVPQILNVSYSDEDVNNLLDRRGIVKDYFLK